MTMPNLTDGIPVQERHVPVVSSDYGTVLKVRGTPATRFVYRITTQNGNLYGLTRENLGALRALLENAETEIARENEGQVRCNKASVCKLANSCAHATYHSPFSLCRYPGYCPSGGLYKHCC